MREIYLDNNATTRPLPEVVAAVAHVMSEGYGNPSSPHRRGQQARETLQQARQHVADLVGARSDQVAFTSGGTEANNIVLRSISAADRPARLITTAIEHSSVLATAAALSGMGTRVDVLEVDSGGRISPDRLEDALAEGADLVSIQWANSETGTLQDIEQLGRVCADAKVPLHVDAAQAVGRLPVNFQDLPADILTYTAHKIHGPQGVGAIVAKRLRRLVPLCAGGDQEDGLRPGTEALALIAGFGKAAQARRASLEASAVKLRKLRDTFEQSILKAVPQAAVNGDIDHRAMNSSSIRFPGVDGIALMAQLDSAGICCSLTSACVSARPEPSHVLLAMGLSEQEAYSSLRFSFSVLNDEDEAKLAAHRVCESYEALLAMQQQTVRRA